MPPIPGVGRNHLIHHVHIADGFADDCEELIHRWLKTDTLTYETFCEIWKDLQFNFVYHGRPSGAEMAELSEELLQIAKHYMVSNTDNIEESIAGLFMVYALLRLQPYQGFAALRVVPEDAPALARIETVARREKRYDVLYILASTLIEGPVQYHAANRERGMDTSIRKYLEGTRGIDRLGVRPKGVFYRQNEESDLLRELHSITKRYQEAKKAIKGHSKELNYTNENLATDLDSSLKEIINGIIDDGPEAAKKMQDHYSKVQRIKEKAMKQAVEGVKYLATVGDGPSSSPMNRMQSEINIRGKGSGYKRSPGKASPRSRSDSAWDLAHTEDSEDSTDDDDEPATRSSRPVELAKDLNLEEFHKETNERTNPNEKESVLDIEIDSLPVFIRTEQDGKMFEIEVIDELHKWKSMQKVKVDAETKLKKLTDVSLEKVDNISEVNPLSEVESQQQGQSEDPLNADGPSGSRIDGSRSKRGKSGSKTEESGSMTEESGSKTEESESKKSGKVERKRGRRMIEAESSPEGDELVENITFKKKEKRDLKKTALRHKFKRLGMLKMANFDDVSSNKKKGK